MPLLQLILLHSVLAASAAELACADAADEGCSALVPGERPSDQPEAGSEVSLLQTGNALIGAAAARGSDAAAAMAPGRLTVPTPVLWVHFVKCGTSFGNTLLSHPQICPSLQAGLSMTAAEAEDPSGFAVKHNVMNKCPGLSTAFVPWGSHLGISQSYEANKGHFMGFFRDPVQRLASNIIDDAAGVQFYGAANLIPRMAGCYARLIARDDSCYGSVPTEAEVQTAITRVREGFSFVGITEQWDLSICLFDAMYGNACLTNNFLNVHKNPERTQSHFSYDDGMVKQYVNKSLLSADRRVFDAALDVFHQNLRRFKVSEASCQACYCRAGLPSCKTTSRSGTATVSMQA